MLNSEAHALNLINLTFKVKNTELPDSRATQDAMHVSLHVCRYIFRYHYAALLCIFTGKEAVTQLVLDNEKDEIVQIFSMNAAAL